MKHQLLLFGKASTEMRQRLTADFIIHDRKGISQWETFVEENAENISAILTNGHDGASKDIIESFPRLKIISCNGVGYDAVDMDSARRHNIMVTHTPEVLNSDVANTALLQILALSRRLMRDGNWIAEGKWTKFGGPPLTDSIEGKHVGILGLGRIGSTIARKLSIFNCTISYHSRNKKNVEYTYFAHLKDMAEAVDYLIVITPGDASTYHMVNREILEALGPNGCLVNIARGSVVDESALVEAIETGTLGAAALDVFEDEPHVPEALFHRDNVLLTPHVGSATTQTRKAMGMLAVNNIVSFIKHGQAVSPVPECVEHKGV